MKNKIIRKKKSADIQRFLRPIVTNKKKRKVSKIEFEVPKCGHYDKLLKLNYNTKQLKEILKHYKQKSSGNKNQLIVRCYFFLKLSHCAIKIQKIFRGSITRQFISLGGEGLKNYKICTNTIDFLTLEKLETIKKDNFFSFKDEDGFIYGFQFSSIYNLILKAQTHPVNPFNRKIIKNNVIKKINKKIRLACVLRRELQISINDHDQTISKEKKFQLRILAAFQKMDELGNYTNQEWFSSLNKFKLIRFVKELIDIWCYRAQLTLDVKKKISPPNGTPFFGIKVGMLVNKNEEKIRKISLTIIENLINKGIDHSSKSLGAFYVLAALTLVNRDAASALPWLYESVRHNTQINDVV